MVLPVIRSKRPWDEHLDRLAKQLVPLVAELVECGRIHHHHRSTLVNEQHPIRSRLHNETKHLLTIVRLWGHAGVFPSISPSFR